MKVFSHLAVIYPEALRLLLDMRADPNVANPFGKTPLMYAAQYNQLRSARLLLAHGADPNAATTRMANSCEYALGTSKMTPLHYATRYGSSSLIQLLVSKGAVTFRKTERRQYSDEPGEYPLDWLRRYTAPESPERNQKVAPAELAKLEDLLRVPDDADRVKLSSRLTLRAESEYAAGSLENAYRSVSAALAANQSNQRALNDLPLMALKTGRLGEALATADTLIIENKTPVVRAAAWFNKGLACEQVPYDVTYGGEHYCGDSRIHPFLKAWQLEHTEARVHKLTELFENLRPSSCIGANRDTAGQQYYFSVADDSDDTKTWHSQSQRVYVYHSSSQSIEPEAVRWDIRFIGRSTATPISPQLIQRNDLGDSSITVLESTYLIQGPVTVGSQTCRYDQALTVERTYQP